MKTGHGVAESSAGGTRQGDAPLTCTVRIICSLITKSDPAVGQDMATGETEEEDEIGHQILVRASGTQSSRGPEIGH